MPKLGVLATAIMQQMAASTCPRAFGLLCSVGLLAYAASTAPQRPQLDPVAELVGKIKSGKTTIKHDSKFGYLKGVLKELGISPSSQTLVWSKTSLQGPRIGPRNPRAIYFNDHTYVGYVQGGDLIEIATVPPEQGPQFYSIENKDQTKLTFSDEFQRCIACHAGPGLGGVPRLLARSVNADKQGYQLMGGGRVVTPRTPLEQRWGGWYVSGSHGQMRHRGNSPAIGDDDSHTFDVEPGANQTSLAKYFDTSQYLAPHSDIVALLVFEHQMHVQNEIIRAGTATRRWLLDPSSTLAEACEPLVEALVGVGEAKFRDPIKGSSGFQKEYEKGSPLRKLELATRLYANALSPMIETASFDGLPMVAKKQVVARLNQIAEGKDSVGRFEHLTQQDRDFIKSYLSASKFKALAVRESN